MKTGAASSQSPKSDQARAQAIRTALDEAQAFLNQGKIQQAEVICRRILDDNPAEPNTLQMLGLMAYRAGRMDGAIAYLRQACESALAPPMVFSNLTEMLRQKGLLSEATVYGRKAVGLAPKSVSAWNNLGIVLQESGQLDEARKCLETVTSLEPDNAEAHNNLGNTFKRLGDIKKAEKHWKRALELKPYYPETYSNLANLFNEQGQYDKALLHGQRAIDLNPLLADAYINLAATESARWRYPAALEWLNLLVAIAPDNPMALATRSGTLKELDRFEEALADAERAVSLAPENAEVQSAYGSVLLSMGRFEEAVARYDTAIALPNAIRERLMISRATAHQEHGKSEDAIRAFDDIIAQYPNSAAAFYGRADLVKFSQNDAELEQMLQLAKKGRLESNSDKISLNFALSKAFLDVGDSDRAFHFLNEANKMKRALIQYDANATSLWVDNLIMAFNADVFDRFRGKGLPSSVPIFVIGMPRSGTTLLEQILASHPKIHGAGELKFVNRVIEERGGTPEFLRGLTPEVLTSMGGAYLDRVMPMANGKPRIVDKMPANFLHAGAIHLMLPQAKIIHARRDPVDTCLSCYSKLFGGEQSFTYNQAELGQFYCDYQRLMDHWRALLPPSHFLEVHYESVVEDIETQARRILNFLDLPWNPACLEFYATERPVRTASVNQVRKPVYKTSSGRWRKHANNLKPLLQALGVAMPPQAQ